MGYDGIMLQEGGKFTIQLFVKKFKITNKWTEQEATILEMK
jgi:hypothetical protein